MQEVEKVLGHEEVIRHLQNAVAMDQVSHSYIFAGEKGSGKKSGEAVCHDIAMREARKERVCSAAHVKSHEQESSGHYLCQPSEAQFHWY